MKIVPVNHPEIITGIMLLDDKFLVIDANTAALMDFFKSSNSIKNKIFLDLLSEQNIDGSHLVDVIKRSDHLTFSETKIHHPHLHKYLDVAITCIILSDKKYYLLTLKESDNESYNNLKAYLNAIINNLPGAVYWKDIEGRYLGCNRHVAHMAGFENVDEMIGKTDYDLCWKEFAADWQALDQEVIATGKTISQEEKAKLASGDIIVELTFKTPLRDEHGKIVGVIGTSLDISDRKKMEEELKEAESLKLKHEVQKNLAHEQEKFVKTANQVAHDIRSPLASLLMIVKSCKEIPEEDRIALREASVGISDIANHLLSRYQKKESELETEEKKPILVSVVLLQLLTEKKYQYQNLSIKFDYDFKPNSYFAFIKLRVSDFKRMVSNLINNAVDAFENKPGKIDVKLEIDSEWVKILIQDNGKGMPKAIVDKIMSNIAVTAGKESGHGIGLTQVREALQNNQGEMTIDSKVGEGTKIILNFPRIKTPHWIAEKIMLSKDDIIIILDDDASIHGAWNSHFDPILEQAPTLQLKHFTVGSEALDYINSLPEDQKTKVFLLTDYELLKQELNGLHVISKSGIGRSILVTSHYAQLVIQNQAAKTGTKILPKQLASEIPIKISDTNVNILEKIEMKAVDVVIVDDDERFVRNLMAFVFEDKAVDPYHNPEHFLQNISKYDKKTKIFIDYNFSNSSLRGMEIAEKLHEQGYERLYILSGEDFTDRDVPSYVVIIRKDDIEKIKDS